MKIQKGQVQYKDRNDYYVTYGITDDGKQYYFITKDIEKFSNGNRIATTALVEAIDDMVKASNVGVISEDGTEVIPFNNRRIKPVNDDIILAEIANPVSQGVIDAVNARSDAASATTLVATTTAVKDKLNAKMGNEGRFIFNDLFSEATVYDINGNNLVNGEYFSFIGLDNGKLYLSKNTENSEITEYSILPPEVQSDITPASDTNSIDVSAVDVPQEVVEGALNNEAVQESVPTPEIPVVPEAGVEVAPEAPVDTNPEQGVEFTSLGTDVVVDNTPEAAPEEAEVANAVTPIAPDEVAEAITEGVTDTPDLGVVSEATAEQTPETNGFEPPVVSEDAAAEVENPVSDIDVTVPQDTESAPEEVKEEASEEVANDASEKEEVASEEVNTDVTDEVKEENENTEVSAEIPEDAKEEDVADVSEEIKEEASEDVNVEAKSDVEVDLDALVGSSSEPEEKEDVKEEKEETEEVELNISDFDNKEEPEEEKEEIKEEKEEPEIEIEKETETEKDPFENSAFKVDSIGDEVDFTEGVAQVNDPDITEGTKIVLRLIDQNKELKEELISKNNEITTKDERIERQEDLISNLTEKGKIQRDRIVLLLGNLKKAAETNHRLQEQIAQQVETNRSLSRANSAQQEEIKLLQSQLQGKEELVKVLAEADAQALVGEAEIGNYDDLDLESFYAKAA